MAADADASVWIVRVPTNPAHLARAWELLSPDEQSYIDRPHAAADIHSFVCGHAALRILLDAHLERPLSRTSFDMGQYGKPYIKGSEVGFSLSRYHRSVAIAIIKGGDIGVDIEPLVYDASNDAIATTRYSLAERQWINETDPENRIRRFYRLWVIREALAKATGEGLGHEARDGVIEIVEDVPVLSGQEWRAREHLLLDEVAAAVVVPRQRSVVWNEISWETLSAKSA